VFSGGISSRGDTVQPSLAVMDINLIKIRISRKQRGSRPKHFIVQFFADFLVPDHQLKCLVLLVFRNFNFVKSIITLR